jgi:hypothetical protein
VASNDPALRTRILESAAGATACSASLDAEAGSDVFPPVSEGDFLAVCAYRVRDDTAAARVADLTYADVLGRRAVRASLAASWAVDGIPAVVHGPTGGKGAMIDSFIGPLGVPPGLWSGPRGCTLLVWVHGACSSCPGS